MITVGLTGGIGSGKSTVSRIFRALGIPVYISDLRAKFLMNHHEPLKQEIIRHFGNVYKPDGTLNKEKLASIIFSDPGKLQLINSLVHPAVYADFEQWVESQRNKPYVIKESAILFETGYFKHLDFTVTVYADLELRIRRTMERDKVTREQVLERIKNQFDDNKKITLADFVIVNNDYVPVLPQVLNLHKFFLKHKV